MTNTTPQPTACRRDSFKYSSQHQLSEEREEKEPYFASPLISLLSQFLPRMEPLQRLRLYTLLRDLLKPLSGSAVENGSSFAAYRSVLGSKLKSRGFKQSPVPQKLQVRKACQTVRSQKEDMLCPICMENIGLEDMVMRCPENFHFFHKHCLTEWILHQTEQNYSQQQLSSAVELENVNNNLYLVNPPSQSCEKPSQQTTCPVCREPLAEKAATFRKYLEDPSYCYDDRTVYEKLLLKVRLYYSFVLQHRKLFLKDLFQFLLLGIGCLKGRSLGPWKTWQTLLYLTMPHEYKLTVLRGYALGAAFKAVLLLKASLLARKS